MPSSQFHYLPLTPAFFSLLVGVLVVVVVLIQLGILRYAYTRIGVGARPALVVAVWLSDRKLHQYSHRRAARGAG